MLEKSKQSLPVDISRRDEIRQVIAHCNDTLCRCQVALEKLRSYRGDVVLLLQTEGMQRGGKLPCGSYGRDFTTVGLRLMLYILKGRAVIDRQQAIEKLYLIEQQLSKFMVVAS